MSHLTIEHLVFGEGGVVSSLNDIRQYVHNHRTERKLYLLKRPGPTGELENRTREGVRRIKERYDGHCAKYGDVFNTGDGK
jgi:hypothetical protein